MAVADGVGVSLKTLSMSVARSLLTLLRHGAIERFDDTELLLGSRWNARSIGANLEEGEQNNHRGNSSNSLDYWIIFTKRHSRYCFTRKRVAIMHACKDKTQLCKAKHLVLTFNIYLWGRPTHSDLLFTESLSN